MLFAHISWNKLVHAYNESGEQSVLLWKINKMVKDMCHDTAGIAFGKWISSLFPSHSV